MRIDKLITTRFNGLGILKMQILYSLSLSNALVMFTMASILPKKYENIEYKYVVNDSRKKHCAPVV